MHLDPFSMYVHWSLIHGINQRNYFENMNEVNACTKKSCGNKSCGNSAYVEATKDGDVKLDFRHLTWQQRRTDQDMSMTKIVVSRSSECVCVCVCVCVCLP